LQRIPAVNLGGFGDFGEKTFEKGEKGRDVGIRWSLRRFWAVPDPKIGLRPLSIHKSETKIRSGPLDLFKMERGKFTSEHFPAHGVYTVLNSVFVRVVALAWFVTLPSLTATARPKLHGPNKQTRKTLQEKELQASVGVVKETWARCKARGQTEETEEITLERLCACGR